MPENKKPKVLYQGKTIIDLYLDSQKEHNNPNAFCSKRNQKWDCISMEEIVNRANAISHFLLEKKIKKGDKVAIVSTSRNEWHVMDLGIIQIGAISVPMYANITSEQYSYILKNSEAKILAVSDKILHQNLSKSLKSNNKIIEVISFDKIKGVNFFYDIIKNKKINLQRIEQQRRKVNQEDVASIIYTSGTTGNSKGVMLTHLNIVSNVYDSTNSIQVTKQDKALSFLPLNHIFERMVSYIYIYKGTAVYFAESIETIAESLKEVKPHLFSSVPRLIEKVFEKIMMKGSELSGIKRKLFFWSVKLAEQYDVRGKNSSWYNFKLSIARKLIFSKWREALGGSVRVIVTGAAACQTKLLKIFSAAGIPIREGYGLTETSPVISINMLEDFYLGTVGQIIPNVMVKIAEDGEIIVKGPNVMIGYYKLPKETKEVLSKDGWFKTGDIGEIIDGRFLKITDRKKEMFKTSGGKFIAPQYIENILKMNKYIENALVIGEGQKFPSAIVQPSWDNLIKWCDENGIPNSKNPKEIIKNQKVINLMEKQVEISNGDLAHYEQIKKIELVPDTWSISTDELTPTLKLKRRVIYKKYQHLIDKIYSSS